MLDYDESSEKHDRLFMAGRIAAAGTYQRVDVRTGRTIVLDRDDWLPASLDGCVAMYRLVVQPVTVGDGRPNGIDSRPKALANSI
jgi:hypothetical protein